VAEEAERRRHGVSGFKRSMLQISDEAAVGSSGRRYLLCGPNPESAADGDAMLQGSRTLTALERWTPTTATKLTCMSVLPSHLHPISSISGQIVALKGLFGIPPLRLTSAQPEDFEKLGFANSAKLNCDSSRSGSAPAERRRPERTLSQRSLPPCTWIPSSVNITLVAFSTLIHEESTRTYFTSIPKSPMMYQKYFS
jgi:hypothetical protein